MLEVVQHGNGFRWQWITDAGRVLVSSPEVFPCDFTAISDAKEYRARFFVNTGAVERTVSAI